LSIASNIKAFCCFAPRLITGMIPLSLSHMSIVGFMRTVEHIVDSNHSMKICPFIGTAAVAHGIKECAFAAIAGNRRQHHHCGRRLEYLRAGS
jgi:hypothetical protein